MPNSVLNLIISKSLDSSILRNKLKKLILKRLKRELLAKNNRNRILEEAKYRYHFYEAVITTFERNIQRNNIDKEFVINLANKVVLKNRLLQDNEIKEEFYKNYKTYPPGFLTLSPTKICNLKCTGCYANSSSDDRQTLSYKYVRAILDENYYKWGNKVAVISGGEPFLYNSEGKTLFDIAEEYNDILFMVYTNGTLIDEKSATKIKELNNMLVAISIEGYEKETDERRGKLVYKKILNSVENLRKLGVPYGFSLTVTKNNFDVVNDDRFFDFYFNELNASFMWVFQFMPIGRGVNTELMITPQQRKILFERWKNILFYKKYPVADFWNSGMISYGCIAYGRAGGYLYIDWNGNIMPCVFVPYYEDNIIDLYEIGKTLTDALFSKLFINGRNWQYSYSYNHPVLNNIEPEKLKNILLPCSIRDHFKNFKENIITENTKAEDENAQIVLNDLDYFNRLSNYEKEMEKEFNPIWEKEFLKK